MATTETDLLESDPVLLSLIHAFSRSPAGEVRPKRRRREWAWSHPFTLDGFPDFLLQEHYELDPSNDVLVWVVRARGSGLLDAKPVELRYGMKASELGDIENERARCQWRLRKLAEAHLRAHLHMVQCRFSPPSDSETTFLDLRGRIREPEV